jgi:hypothetical protein
MRVFAVLAMLASPAVADPPKKKPVTLPDIVKEATAPAKRAEPSGVLGVDGKVAAGIVIPPPDHPDSKLREHGGSIIIPPDPNDPMAFEMGTMQLRSKEKIEPWLPRDLSRSLKRGADKVWDVLLPKL